MSDEHLPTEPFSSAEGDALSDEATQRHEPPGILGFDHDEATETDVAAHGKDRTGTNDRYKVTAAIGRGGMGEVVKARDERLLRNVALKKVHTYEDEEAFARFTAEARIGSQLDHPAVLPVYDYGHDDSGAPFFTMKLVEEHRSLAQVIALLKAGHAPTVDAFSFPRRVALVQSLCHALDHAHRRGVVHRDLKPANIVLGQSGEVFIVDWGIAHVLSGHEGGIELSPALRETLQRCEAQSLVGTAPYMAPEALAEGVSDPATDTFSLCVILYELLTLQHPFGAARDPLEVFEHHKRLPPPAAERQRDPHYGRIPRALSQLCARGLARNREDRFESAAALEASLQKWLEGASPVVCPGTLVQRVLRRTIYLIDQHPVAAPAALLVLGCVMLAWLVTAVLNLVDAFVP